MRLEILIDSEEPVIYHLNKSEIVIGAGDACDIILGSAGVSRKHVKVIVEKDSYFVIDQGSTNGTFINEERLVPGRKTEFTSFFPVRLGDRVLLTLLSDEEAHASILQEFTKPKEVADSSNHETTRVISLKDMQAGTTKNLVSNRQQTVAKRKTVQAPIKKAKKKTEDTRMMKTVVFAVFLFASVAYYKFFYAVEPLAPVPVLVKKEKVPPAAEVPVEVAAPVVSPDYLIPKVELIQKDKIANLFADLKCIIPDEIYFCDKIPALKKGNGGVAAVGSSLVFLVEQSTWFGQAQQLNNIFLKRNHLDLPLAGEIMINENVQKLSFMSFLKSALSNIDLKEYLERDFYIVFYQENEQALKVTTAFAIKAQAIPEVIKLYDDKFIETYGAHGGTAFEQANKYFQFY